MREFVRKYGILKERGFTLMESLLVVGLTTLIAVGIVAGLIEGLETLHEMADRQSVEFGHQKAMEAFMEDIHAAEWFYNGTTHDETGAVILRDTADVYTLTMGYTGPDGEEVWIRYRAHIGAFSQDTYLMRTIASTSGLEGVSLITQGVANLEFGYYREDGSYTDKLSEVKTVAMLLSLNVGGATIQREYEASLRNVNQGVRACPFDFADIEARHFTK